MDNSIHKSHLLTLFNVLMEKNNFRRSVLHFFIFCFYI